MQLVVTPSPDIKEIEIFRKDKLIARWFRAMERLIHIGEVEVELGDRIVTVYKDGRTETYTR